MVLLGKEINFWILYNRQRRRKTKGRKKTDIYAIRASGLIPVIPLTTINKDTQLPMCIEEQASF